MSHDHGHGHQHGHQHGHGHDHVGFDEAEWARWAAETEREGEVLLDFVTSTATRLATLPGWEPPATIADVGSGPAVAACEFARMFPHAEVVAFDSSAGMLERATARIDRLGLGGRVRVVEGAIPDDLGRVAPIDLLWASLSLHHVGDEVGAIRAFLGALTPDGVVAIAEFADPMRVLPDDLGVGRPGLTGRLEAHRAAWFAQMRHDLPSSVESQDLAIMVEAAGGVVLDDRVARIRIDGPLPDETRRFVETSVRRTRSHLEDVLDADDLATLDALLDPTNPLSIARRDDVYVDASRRIVLTRPAVAVS